MRDGTVTRFSAQIEIDHERGVIYVHLARPGDVDRLGVVTLLRICRLPVPIPVDTALDITHMHGTDWSGAAYEYPVIPRVFYQPQSDDPIDVTEPINAQYKHARARSEAARRAQRERYEQRKKYATAAERDAARKARRQELQRLKRLESQALQTP